MNKRDLHDAAVASQRFARRALLHLDCPNASALQRDLIALKEALKKLENAKMM